MTNKEKYKQVFSALHPSNPICLEEMTMKKAKIRKIYKPIAAAVCAVMLFGSATAAYAADLGGIRQTIEIWMRGNPAEVEMVDNGNGNYEFSFADGSKRGAGGLEIGADGSSTPLSAEEVAETFSNEVSVEEDGRVWLYYKSYAVDITDQMTDTGCKVVLDDEGEKVYFTISAPNGLGSCSFPRTFSPEDDRKAYIPVN